MNTPVTPLTEWSFSINPATRLVTVTASGVLQYTDLLAFARAVKGDPRFDPHFDFLYDLADVRDIHVTADQAAHFAWLNIAEKSAHVAVLATRDVVYGVCREVIAYMSDEELAGLVLCRQREEIRQWLVQRGK